MKILDKNGNLDISILSDEQDEIELVKVYISNQNDDDEKLCTLSYNKWLKLF